METIIAHPENGDKLKAIKAVLKALNVAFETKAEKPYTPEFVEKIKCSEEDIAAGRVHKISLDEIWK